MTTSAPARHAVCVVGSANLDLVVTAPRHPNPGETVLGQGYAEHPGGKGLNQAVAAARAGASTTMVAALGDDAAGDGLARVLSEEGIDDRHLRRVAAPTGRALITVTGTGENTIVVVPGANEHVAAENIPECDVLLVQLEIPLDVVEAAVVTAAARDATIVLNPAPAQELPAGLLAAVDVVIPNEHEVELLGGPETLLAHGPGAVVVTRGGAGVDVHTSGEATHIPAFPVEVVDTTAAGDAFCGVFCARLAAGDTLSQAVRRAAAAGALATTRAGAIPSIPLASAIADLLATSETA